MVSLVAHGESHKTAMAMAVAELGSPRKARQQYHRVYFTRQDALRLTPLQQALSSGSLTLCLIGFIVTIGSFVSLHQPGEKLAPQIFLLLFLSGMAVFGIVRYVFGKRLRLVLWAQAAFMLMMGFAFIWTTSVMDFEHFGIRAVAMMFSTFAFVRFMTFAFETQRLVAKMRNATTHRGQD